MDLTEGTENPAYDVASATTKETPLSQDVSKGTATFDKKKVAFLGSGDMTLALATAMGRAGLHAIVGSRNPERSRVRLEAAGAKVTTIKEALTESDLVILAIPSDHHDSLPREQLENKIVVDISNRAPGSPPVKPSIAERLQEILPESHVVKAFNTLSAYALQHGNIQGSREIPICGNSEVARTRVTELTRDLGLTPVDRGALRNAPEVEEIPLAFFPEWKLTGILALIFFLFWYIFMLFRTQLCPNFDKGGPFDGSYFGNFPLLNTQYSMAYTATCLLLITYIPGVIAAYIQLYRGTKYSNFPSWLDRWLKSRKQLGLMALLIGATHGCSAIFTQIGWGVYYPEEWAQQLHFILAGFLMASLAVLGITSLPSVSARLTWREFSVLQRYLGWASVFFVTGHAIFSDFYHLTDTELVCGFLPLGTQIIVVLCLLTIAIKLPLLLPCIDSHLMKIRRGYERNPQVSPA